MAKAILARTLRGTPRNLRFLARQLAAGELVAVPTETVYGLAANALDADACAKIFTAKGRPATDPLIVHLFSARQLAEVCTPNAAALRLAEAFWPGPLTMVLPKQSVIPDIVTSGRDSVAVRVPAHPVFRRLLKLAALPLAAPSANPFGYVSPTTAAHVLHGLGKQIKYVLEGGATSIGLESTIIDLTNENRPRLLRPGAITRDQLEAVLRRRVAVAKKHRAGDERVAQVAPGMLKRHYSPRTPVSLHRRIRSVGPTTEAYVFFRRPEPHAHGPNVFWLHETADAAAAARKLFAMLRQLDGAGFQRLHFELAPGHGLADAINDRLRRAAAR